MVNYHGNGVQTLETSDRLLHLRRTIARDNAAQEDGIHQEQTQILLSSLKRIEFNFKIRLLCHNNPLFSSFEKPHKTIRAAVL
jgi:hypothetical protein